MIQKILQHPALRQGAQMFLWRGVALLFGAAGSIWAARAFGPQKLGISAMVVALAQQLMLLVDMNQNALLVRTYKKQENEDERKQLVAGVFTWRLVSSVLLGLSVAAGAWFWGLEREWWLAVFAGVPFLVFISNEPLWVLQGQDNVPAQYRAMAIRSFLSAGIFFLFFRPGISAGWDVVVQAGAFGTAAVCAWFWALKPWKGNVPLLNWKDLKAYFPLIFRGRWLFFTGIVMYVYSTLESPLVGWLYSVEELGKYRTATISAGALQSFTLMVPILMYPRYIEWRKEGDDVLWHRQKKLFFWGGLLWLPAVGLTFGLAPLFYRICFGEAFMSAAYPFAILATAKWLAILSGIFGWGLWAQEHDKTMLSVLGVAAVFSLTLNLFLIPRFGMWGAASVHLASEVVILAGCLFFAKRRGRGRWFSTK